MLYKLFQRLKKNESLKASITMKYVGLLSLAYKELLQIIKKTS